MDIKKLVLACASLSLLYSGDVYAAKRGQKRKADIESSVKAGAKKQKTPGNKLRRPQSAPNGLNKAEEESNLRRTQSAPGNLARDTFNKKSQNAKRNANNRAIKLLAQMSYGELTIFPTDFLSVSDEKFKSFEDVGSEFGAHIQDVWNINYDELEKPGSKIIKTLLDDLKYTTTYFSLYGGEESQKGDDYEYNDTDFDFSETNLMDFQSIISRYENTKAFYYNALTQILHFLHTGTNGGHVFWHGMFKIMVKLMVADLYVPALLGK